MSNLLNRFVRIIPAEETYFIALDKPAAKITKEAISLNFASLCPFKESEIIYYYGRNKLFLWFVPKGWLSGKISVPEGFLLYNAHKDKQNAIIVREKGEKIVFIVVKEGALETQIVKSRDIELDRFMVLLEKEYSLVLPSIIKIHGLNALMGAGVRDVAKFASVFNVAPQAVLKSVFEGLKVPLIVSLLLLNVGDITTYFWFNHLLSQEKKSLCALKSETISVKKQFRYLEKQKAFWDDFRKRELKYPRTAVVLNILAKELLKHQGYIKTFRQGGSVLHAWVVSDSSSALVENLMKTGYFSNIKILDIFQRHKETAKEVAQLEIDLKRWQ